MKIQWLLLDLGNVCLEVNQGSTYRKLAESLSLTSDEAAVLPAKQKLLFEEAGVRELSPAEFHALMAPTLPRAIAESVMVECLNAELGPVIEHTVEVIEKVRSQVSVGCLSNTNSIHATKLLLDYPFMELFQRRFFSQELKLRKPDRAIYERTGELLQVPGESILFFDDREENVEGALQCGWRAFLYTGPESLSRGLLEYGIEVP